MYLNVSKCLSMPFCLSKCDFVCVNVFHMCPYVSMCVFMCPYVSKSVSMCVFVCVYVCLYVCLCMSFCVS